MSQDTVRAAMLPSLYVIILVVMLLFRLTSQRKYVDTEKRFLQQDGELVVALNDFLSNTLVHKTFFTSNAEHERVRKAMVDVRDTGYTSWAMQEANGKNFMWLLWLLEACLIFFGPIFTEIFLLPFGTLLAIISNVSSLNGSCTTLLDTMEVRSRSIMRLGWRRRML